MFKGTRSPVTLTVKSEYCELFLLRKIDLIKLNDFKDHYGRIMNKSKLVMKKLQMKIKKNKYMIRQDLKKSVTDETNLNKNNNGRNSVSEPYRRFNTYKTQISSNLKISKKDLSIELSKTMNNKTNNTISKSKCI